MMMLAGAKKKPRQRSYGKRKKAEDQEMKQSEDQAPAQSAEDKVQFERVTEAADFLMRSGEVDVYSQIQEDFLPEEELLVQRRAASAADGERRVTFEETKEQEPPKPEVMWEYKGADGQVHGPFPTSSFVAWQAQGYFKGEGAVDMRRVEEPAAAADAKEKEEQETKEQEPKISAEQELLNDFEDSDDEEETKQETDTQDRRWERSDQIDFSRY